MDSDALKTLGYKKNDKFISVPDFQISSLRLFIEYCKYRARANNPVTDYILLTQQDLDHVTLVAPVTITSPVPGLSIYPPTTLTLAMKDFNRGIKRDPNCFHKFNNERNWSDFHDHTTATANSQNMENVLDITYVPIDADDADLFHAQQKYVFQVFVTNLKLTRAKN